MPSYFNNKTLFIDDESEVIATATIHAQPSHTRIYVENSEVHSFSGSDSKSLGVGASLKNKKVRIHTSVQDKLENTDDIKVKHQVDAGTKTTKSEVNTTASEEGEIFDIFTDIRIY